MKKYLVVLLFSIVAGFPAFGNDLPDLGDASQSAMSPAAERKLGEQIMEQIRAAPAYLDDPEVADYLNTLGFRLVSGSPDPAGAYEFFGIADSSVNAFALPGGFIGIHSGLLLTAQTESELASVLGHEIAHVSQRHLARMVAAQERAGLASMAAIAIAILAARSNAQVSQAALVAAQAGSIQSQLNFTREHEREADRVGLQILNGAGFDLHAMPIFFERLQRSSRVYESGAPSYLMTHPLTFERIADIQNRIQDIPYRPVPDSMEFGLVRARVAALDGNAAVTAANFQSMLADKKFSSEATARYGLAVALQRAGEHSRARAQVEMLRALNQKSPMIDALSAQTLLATGDIEGGLAAYRAALLTHPERRMLIYGYADALITANKPADAIGFLVSRPGRRSTDARLHEIEAKAYSAQGKRMLQHRAQAEAQVLKGNLPAAIQQLQIAEQADDGDFYEKSGIEARIKELKAKDSANRRKP